MCGAIFVLTGVQIYPVSENIHFSSTKSNIKISPLKCEKALKNQGLSGRYLFCRPLMVEATGFEPTTSASRTLRATNCATPRLKRIYYSKCVFKSQFFFMLLGKLFYSPCFSPFPYKITRNLPSLYSTSAMHARRLPLGASG